MLMGMGRLLGDWLQTHIQIADDAQNVQPHVPQERRDRTKPDPVGHTSQTRAQTQKRTTRAVRLSV